ncbi:Lrp/AsnC ligand binding domain-containing protein [Rhizobium croatiense]|uniref:Lrp/AsnC ligand binding domain-containing protein n=1 Tax=Rhizobium croatiense TaxID=2867516 RepID=UPI001FEA7DF7|nr:Lrp/AsnC ligand binding domain-containing protein [Rhizobium croatiense]
MSRRPNGGDRSGMLPDRDEARAPAGLAVLRGWGLAGHRRNQGTRSRSFVEVEMHSESGATHDATKKSFAEAPEVQQCYYVTGEVDFILIVVIRTVGDYEAMTRRLFFANKNVKRFRSFKSGARKPLASLSKDCVP